MTTDPDVSPSHEAPRDGAGRSRSRWRFAVSIVLLVVAIIATPLVVIGAWAKVQINDTDRYVDTVAPLADEPEVQQYVASQLVDAFNDNVDVAGFVAEELPSQLQGLAPTITSAVEGLVSAAANRFTASPAFKTIWVDANRAAHRVISGLLTGDPEALELSDGQLSLDLGDALRALQTRLVDSGFELAGRVDLSGVEHQVVLADGPRLAELEDAREMVGRLDRLVWVSRWPSAWPPPVERSCRASGTSCPLPSPAASTTRSWTRSGSASASSSPSP
jgi:hypothetical protein